MTTENVPRRTAFVGVALVSLASLLLELSLTRLFSATIYYHYGFMAISLALFGSGASGVLVYLARKRFSPPPGTLLVGSSILFVATTVVALLVILGNPLRLDPGSGDSARLVLIYAVTSLPFFFAGLTITTAITTFAHEIGTLYFYDLGGAALGCLVVIPALDLLGAINAILLVAVFAGVAAVLFASAFQGRKDVAAVALAGVVLLLGFNTQSQVFQVQFAKGQEERRLLFSKWNSFSRVTVRGDLNDQALGILIDADAGTLIVRDGGHAGPDKIRKVIEGLAYALRTPSEVLVIGAGGGLDVIHARNGGAKNVTAVEINPIIARSVMSSEPFKSYSGELFFQPGVKLVVDEGRSFIRSSEARYDLIQATMVDTWAATAAGAFSLTENNLYTVEAFKDFLEHLNENGLLAMTRWHLDPPDQTLRLVMLARAALKELGIADHARRIVLVTAAPGGPTGKDGPRTPATFIVSKSPLSDDEVRRLEAHVAAHGWRVVYSPLTKPDALFKEAVETERPEALWVTSWGSDVSPTRDNNPFFFNSVRFRNLSQAVSGTSEWHKTNVGTMLLLVILGFTSFLVAIFIGGPLVLARRELEPGAGSWLAYFATLGAAFIIVEVALVQKFILFLGHPVYALVVVLFSLLLFSAVGSRLSTRFSEERLPRTATKVIALLVGVVLVDLVLLPKIFYGLVGLPQPARIAIAVATMAPLAILMGMPMPSGIRLVARRAPSILPWAWGVNGATSVVGSSAALTLAILTGFDQAIAVGAGLYVLAALLIRRVPAATRVADVTAVTG